MAKILIIDDDGIVLDALNVFLSRAGHEVITSMDGANGLLIFRNTLPDIVILDRDLPAMSGSEVLTQIKSAPHKTEVIILTGYDDPEDAQQYLEAGATAFLSKGDGLSNVLSEIDRLIGSPAGTKPAQQPTRERQVTAIAPALASDVKILVVDDEASIRDVLCRFIVSLGYAAIPAENGAQALELAKKEGPDIALLDIAMPIMDGISTLAELRKTNPQTGVIMITANQDEELAKDCLQHGAFDYLPKPVNLAALETLIKSRLLIQKQYK